MCSRASKRGSKLFVQYLAHFSFLWISVEGISWRKLILLITQTLIIPASPQSLIYRHHLLIAVDFCFQCFQFCAASLKSKVIFVCRLCYKFFLPDVSLVKTNSTQGETERKNWIKIDLMIRLQNWTEFAEESKIWRMQI